MTKKILFICTGNYYRSRYAEIFFNDLAAKKRLNWSADSRGLEASEGRNIGPISKFALDRLTLRRLSPGDPIRYPLQLEEKDLQEAGLIIAIHRVEHQPMMTRLFPTWASRITYWEIPDLNMMSSGEALSAIEENIHAMVDRLSMLHSR